MQAQRSSTHVRNADELLHNVRPFSRILFTEYGIGHPMGDLKVREIEMGRYIWVCNVVLTLYLIRSDDNRSDAVMVFTPVLSRTHQAFRRLDLHVQLTLDHSQLPRYLKGIEV